MKKISLQILLIILTHVVLPVLKAQHTEVMNVLKKCQEYYSSRPVLQFDMKYVMYDSYTSSNIIHQLTGSYQISNGMIRIQNGGQLQLMNDKYSVVADDITQTLVVQDHVDKKNSTPMGIDSLMGLFGQTKVENNTDQEVIICFEKPKASFYTVIKLKVRFDKLTGKVIGATMYYAFDLKDFYNDYSSQTIPRIEIVYSNYSESNDMPVHIFSETELFKVNEGKLNPTGIYKNYRLIDLRSTSR